MKERNQAENSNKTVLCGNCKAFIEKAQFYRHRDRCVKKNPCSKDKPFTSTDTSKLKQPCSSAFKEDILDRFRDDDVGKLCKTNETLIYFGQKQYEKVHGKKDKQDEVRKSVMSDMRRMANLFLIFQEECDRDDKPKDPRDMLRRNKFKFLEAAVRTYTTDEKGNVKAGLKFALYYLIQNFATITSGLLLSKEDDKQADDISKFKAVFKLNEKSLFGDAIYLLIKNRQTKLRKPASMTREKDLKLVRDFTVQSIDTLVRNFGKENLKHEYVRLRDLAISRLTLFNCRRGGEPCRLLLSEWEDGENGAWIDEDRLEQLDPEEQRLFREMAIMYQEGKGNRLVSVLVPKDTIKALRILADQEIRQAAGVNAENKYLFANTTGHKYHTAGWNAVENVNQQCGVKNLNATKIRHLISTIYASMEVPEEERSYFYRHMGHAKEINENVYQTPLVQGQFLKVAPFLKQVDEGVLPGTSTRGPAGDTSKTPEVLPGTSTHGPAGDTSKTPGVLPGTSTRGPTGDTSKSPEVLPGTSTRGPAGDTSKTPEVLPGTSTRGPTGDTSKSPENKSRPYRRMTKEDADLVTSYFSSHIEDGRLPKKAEITEFQRIHGVRYASDQIRNKVMNEGNKHKACLRKLQNMTM